ncbi:MAG TPA: polysaccharide biosynthesis/export family protein [Terracidiphilus sp.]|nr:polysaccharide biosynthesis/export family protein [Terracidiphilus sp.]
MNRLPWNSLVSLLLAGAVGVCAAQSAPAPAASSPVAAQAQQPPDPQLKPNPLEALRKFEPAADEEYRLGRGDQITVDFTGRPELQAKLVIGPDGRITLPLAGEVMVANLTREEAARKIEQSLTPYYTNLSAMVTVTQYTANRVLVLGAVDHPGPITFDGNPTLLEAITRGGLPTVGPDKRPQLPDRCTIYRGSDQVMTVQLRALVDSGSPLADLRLRRDDVVYVPDPMERFVSVLGEVNHPGAVPLLSNSTLPKVLADAGGITDKAGSKPKVVIVDPSAGTKRTIDFQDLLNPAHSLEVTLKPGDIIYVPQSGFYRFSYYMQSLNPFAELATLAAVNGAL